MYVCMYVCVYMRIIQPLPHGKDLTQGQVFGEYNWFEFRVFIILHWLPNPS